MHEASLVRDLVARVVETAHANGAGEVARVAIDIGPNCHLTPAVLRAHYEVTAAGTAAAGAELTITEVDGGGLLLRAIDVDL